MKKIYTFLLLFVTALTVGFAQSTRNVDSRDHAVLLSAEVKLQPPSITLKWEKNEFAKEYRVYRKLVTESAFGANTLATLDSNATEFVDKTAVPSLAYEYEVWAYSLGFLNEAAFNFWGFGYIMTGIDVPEYDQPGYVILLIDDAMADALTSEITRLKNDLRAEGWGIIEKNVPRTEKFDGVAVKQTKKIILDEYKKYGANIKSIYILGRVAVPYSGDLNPDGHSDHKGAWPADIYYGYTNELNWTDVSVNNVTASREENKNIPGDGKFDQSSIASSAIIPVGRVDLYGMKAFHAGLQDPEADLLRRYLDKNHSYRNGQMEYTVGGIIDDNFSAASYVEGFASSGWRNFGVLAGGKNVKKADWFTELGTNNYLFAYGCGGGSYTSCGGVGETKDFAAKPVNAVFTMLFGSYFGDWDAENNLLRATIASDPMTLTCAWDARPHWYFHHMSYGYPIGYSALLSHNNNTVYKPNILYTAEYPNGIIYAIGMKNIHTALIGDPTLKLAPNTVPSPKNLSIAVPTGNEFASTQLTWEEPEIDGEYHFNVYRSFTEYGLYEKVNYEPIKGNSFNEELSGEKFHRFDGEIYYMVRTAQLETNNSGRYYNVSRGVISNVFVTDVNEDLVESSSMSVSPNPANDFANISIITQKSAYAVVEISDINGNLIVELSKSYLEKGNHNFGWNLRNNMNQVVPQGIYFVKVKFGNDVLVQKLSVIR